MGKFCFEVDDSLKAVEMGAMEILIVWENLDITQYILKTGVELELVENVPSGMACKQVRRFWCHVGDCNRQESRRFAILQRVWRHWRHPAVSSRFPVDGI